MSMMSSMKRANAIHCFYTSLTRGVWIKAAAITSEVQPCDELPGIAVLQMWRVYQRGLERWIADLLQPVFDNLVTDGMVPRFVQARERACHAHT